MMEFSFQNKVLRNGKWRIRTIQKFKKHFKGLEKKLQILKNHFKIQSQLENPKNISKLIYNYIKGLKHKLIERIMNKILVEFLNLIFRHHIT
jgi:hypothetical protein